MIMTARSHSPGDTEVIRNNKSHWSGFTILLIMQLPMSLGHSNLINFNMNTSPHHQCNGACGKGSSIECVQLSMPAPEIMESKTDVMKIGTPQNGDPGSPFSQKNGDPGPYFHNILGTPGSPFSQDFGDPLMKMGTPSAIHLQACTLTRQHMTQPAWSRHNYQHGWMNKGSGSVLQYSTT